MGFVKFFRVKHWFYFLGFTILGIVFSGGKLLSVKSLITLTASTLLLAFGFAVNGAYDHRKGIKKSFIPAFLSLPLLFLMNPSELIVFGTTFILLFLYSHPRSNFQAVPILGTLLNPIVFCNLFLLGWLPSSALTNQGIFLYSLLFVLELASQLIHEGMDYEEDKKIKKRTSTVRFGKRIVKPLTFLCLLAGVFFSIPLGPYFYVLVAGITVYYSSLMRRLNDFKRLRKVFKNLGVMAGIIWLVSKTLFF